MGAGLYVLSGKDVLEDFIRLPKALLYVAAANLGVGDDVRTRDPGKRLLDFECVHVLVDQWAARFHRFERIENPGPFLIFDIDQVDSLARDLLAQGRHRSHRLAGVADLLPGEERLVTDSRAESVRRVVAADRRAHTPQFAGAAEINGNDSGMGIGRSQCLGVEHSRQREVRTIGPPAGDLVDRLAALHRLPNVAKLLGRPGGRFIIHCGCDPWQASVEDGAGRTLPCNLILGADMGLTHGLGQ